MMKSRKIAIVCQAIAAVGWGVCLCTGYCDGIPWEMFLYAVAFVCSLLAMGMNIAALRKDSRKNDADEGENAL